MSKNVVVFLNCVCTLVVSYYEAHTVSLTRLDVQVLRRLTTRHGGSQGSNLLWAGMSDLFESEARNIILSDLLLAIPTTLGMTSTSWQFLYCSDRFVHRFRFRRFSFDRSFLSRFSSTIRRIHGRRLSASAIPCSTRRCTFPAAFRSEVSTGYMNPAFALLRLGIGAHRKVYELARAAYESRRTYPCERGFNSSKRLLAMLLA